MQKAWKPALCTKIDEKAHSERRFLAKNRFLANFWAPPGSPGPSRDDPENSQNRSFFSFMVNCVRKRARAASGRPQEGPGGPPRRPRGGILCPFFVLVLYAKSNRKKRQALQRYSNGMHNVLFFASPAPFSSFLFLPFPPVLPHAVFVPLSAMACTAAPQLQLFCL